MIWFGKGVLAVVFVAYLSVAARADRLSSVWIGPNGTGGEGNWNSPSNWNLGVVPNNGTDGNGDGVPDIFDVRIDALPASASFVHGDTRFFEVTGLTLDSGDTLELFAPSGLHLNDPDGTSEIVNNGIIRLSAPPLSTPRLHFRGESLRLSGNGTIDLAVLPAQPGNIAPLEGGRIFNGPNHMLRVIGPGRIGRIGAFVSTTLNYPAALTNEGTILAADGARLDTYLTAATHVNDGVIEAKTGSEISFGVNNGGSFRNRGLMVANEDAANLVFMNESASTPFSNFGVIEARNSGVVTISGVNIPNDGPGIIRAREGGVIRLENGTFHPDPAIQLLDSQSKLIIGVNAVFENSGNVLSGGLGTLAIGANGLPSLVRGGEITSGLGSLQLNGAMLEDVKLTGSASGLGMQMRGRVSFEGGFTLRLDGGFYLQGDFGPGLSVASDLERGGHITAAGNLTLSDVDLVLTGGQVGNPSLIAIYGGRRIGTFKHVTPGYEVFYDDPNKFIRVTLIPEPATWVFVLAAVTMVLVWRFRPRLFAMVLFMLMPLAARGEVVYRSNPDLDEHLIDLDYNGAPDFRFWSMPDASLSIDHILSSVTGVDGFSSSGLLVDSENAARMADRSSVGPSEPQGFSWQNAVVSHQLSLYRDFAGWSGDWDHTGEGIIGVSFQSESGLHYGWIRLTLNNQFIPMEGAPGPLLGYLRLGPVIQDWAYESTPDTPIVAGAVPEPAGVALAVVAMVVGVLVWRLGTRGEAARTCVPTRSVGSPETH